MSLLAPHVARMRSRIERRRPFRIEGAVRRVTGVAVESQGPPGSVGDACELISPDGGTMPGRIVGFAGERVFSMPLGGIDGVGTGTRVRLLDGRPTISVPTEALLGRVLDAEARPIDGGAPLPSGDARPLDVDAPPALERECIRLPFATGVRSIDTLTTLGRGQRVGIFAGSGVGKSTLLGMIARGAQADVIVIGLVGERGREVREFVENDLGESGRSRAVVVAATSDEPPMRRIVAAQSALTIAEAYRDRGANVLLMIDSITRVAMAQREIGLALGEPPTAKGYTPSVFGLLPRLLERAGALENGGSITGLFTVYVEGDDLNDPIADAARSILDGHIVLSRRLADAGRYPAVDSLASVSRVMRAVVPPERYQAASTLRRRMAAFREAEDLVMLGAYPEGTDPDVDAALRSREAIDALLLQPVSIGCSLEESWQRLESAVAAGDES